MAIHLLIFILYYAVPPLINLLSFHFQWSAKDNAGNNTGSLHQIECLLMHGIWKGTEGRVWRAERRISVQMQYMWSCILWQSRIWATPEQPAQGSTINLSLFHCPVIIGWCRCNTNKIVFSDMIRKQTYRERCSSIPPVMSRVSKYETSYVMRNFWVSWDAMTKRHAKRQRASTVTVIAKAESNKAVPTQVLLEAQP